MKIVCFLLFFSAVKLVYAQSYEGRRIQIKNQMLQMQFNRYVDFVTKWADKHQIKDYVVRCKIEKNRRYTTFILDPIVIDTLIYKANPSLFTVIRGKVFLFKNGFEDFCGDNHQFLDYIKQTFCKNLISVKHLMDSAKIASQKNPKYNTNDSIYITNKKTGKKEIYYLKDSTPYTVPPEYMLNLRLPDTYELIFRDENLEETKQYE